MEKNHERKKNAKVNKTLHTKVHLCYNKNIYKNLKAMPKNMKQKNQKAKDDILLKIPATFKIVESKGDEQKGVIEAYVSIFNNVDLVGDVIEQGAFAESLAKKLPKGVWSHKWDEPIAKTLEAREDNKGLFIKGQFIEGVQRADEAYKLIKGGVIDEFSIGFRVLDDEWREDGVRVIKKAKLYEWSPVLAGANPDTELVNIKSDKKEEKKCDDCADEDKPEEETPAEKEEEKKEAKGVIEDELNVDWVDREKKWAMVDKMDNVLYKFFDVYFRATTKSSDFKALVKEVGELLDALADRYEEITANIKEDKDKAEIKEEMKSAIIRVEKFIAEKQIKTFDFVKVDEKKGEIKMFYKAGGEKKSKVFKMSDNFIKYQRDQKGSRNTKVDNKDGEGKATQQKILRIRQAVQQAKQANDYVLRITKKD